MVNKIVSVLMLIGLAGCSNQQSNINQLLDEATAHKSKGDCSQAIQLYSKVLKLDKNNTAALVRRSYCYVITDSIDKAITDINLAIEVEPENNTAIFNRAGIFMQTKQYQKALEDYDVLNNRGVKMKNLEAYRNQAIDSLGINQ